MNAQCKAVTQLLKDTLKSIAQSIENWVQYSSVNFLFILKPELKTLKMVGGL